MSRRSLQRRVRRLGNHLSTCTLGFSCAHGPCHLIPEPLDQNNGPPESSKDAPVFSARQCVCRLWPEAARPSNANRYEGDDRGLNPETPALLVMHFIVDRSRQRITEPLRTLDTGPVPEQWGHEVWGEGDACGRNSETVARPAMHFINDRFRLRIATFSVP